VVEVWPVVKIAGLETEITDLSRIFFFPNSGLPINLRAFAGSKIRIYGNLRPAVNNYLMLASNLIIVDYVDRNQALTTSGASEMVSKDFRTITYIPPDVDDELNVSGSGVYFVAIQSLGTKRNILDPTTIKTSPNFAVQDTTVYSSGYDTPYTVFTVDLGNVITGYLYNLNSNRTAGSSGYAYYKIIISSDGQTWTDLTPVRTVAGPTETFFFEMTFFTARYLAWQAWQGAGGINAMLRIRKLWIIA